MSPFLWTWWRIAYGWPPFVSNATIQDNHGTWRHLAGRFWWLRTRYHLATRVSKRSAPIAKGDLVMIDLATGEAMKADVEEARIRGHVWVNRAAFPHCDDLVLHREGACAFCDMYPDRQAERRAEAVNFTGESDPGKLPCPSTERRPLETINRWPGNRPSKERS